MAQTAENKLEKGNWAAWKKRYGREKPANIIESSCIEIIAGRTGLSTVRVITESGKPVFLHSSVDPVKEAQRVAENVQAPAGAVVVVYGLGLGYLVEALLDKLDEKVPLFVLEPDGKLFWAAMRTRNLRPIIESPRVYILPGDSRDAVKAKFFQFYNSTRYTQLITTGLPGHQTVYTDYWEAVIINIRDVVSAKLLNLNTMIKLGPDMMASAVLNLPHFYSHPGVRELYDKFTDVPAIIVSAGPSLNKNIHLLQEAKGKAVILAVGTAAKALQKQGIQPDFLVSLDPHPLNYEHFKEIDTEKICLLAELQSNHMIFENYKGPMFVSGKMTLLNWFGGLFEDKGVMESGGSVANSAMSIAYKMGADPIILVGQDLAYSKDGHSHAAGTNYEDKVLTSQEGLTFINVKANDGGELLTDRAFYQFLCYFEMWIRRKNDRIYINATEGGAFIEGTKIMTLRETLDQYCQNSRDIKKVIQQALDSFEVPNMEPFIEKFENQIEKIDHVFTEIKTALKRLKQLEKACESKKGKEMQQHVKAVKRIFQRFTKDEFISNLPEWFAKRDLHQVLYRTHQAENSGEDDFRAAIADYTVYYEMVHEGAERLKSLFETCIKQVEGRNGNGQ